MWWQDDVPELIQMCLDSIKKHHPNLIIITNKNYQDYLEIPEYIMKKFNEGIISPPHFSDYIRMALLDKYGGTWIDASCYLLAPVPTFILKQDFSLLKNYIKERGFSNYFIHSAKNNCITKVMKLCLEYYWRNENITVDYWFFHLLMLEIIKQSSICRNIFDNIICENTLKTKMISKFSGMIDYDADVWDYFKRTSFMYKISRKSASANNPNSFIQHLLTEWKKNKTETKI